MSQQLTEKHDCFVGNLPFTATEEQLVEIFSLVGPIKKIRMLNDKDTGRPKGFAFVEYYDPMVALAAIRHLNNTELGGKALRVGFSSNSTLKERAKEMGQDVLDTSGSATQSIVNSLALHEAWDILDSMKRLADDDKHAARALLESYPQFVFALFEIQKRLGVVSGSTAAGSAPPQPGPPIEFIVPNLLAPQNQYSSYQPQAPQYSGYSDPNMLPPDDGYYHQYSDPQPSGIYGPSSQVYQQGQGQGQGGSYPSYMDNQRQPW